MIKITSFFPFSNLLRVTQEFYEDKAVVKMKSLTFEREFEFKYSELGEISDAYYISESQNHFGFWLFGFTAFAFSIANNLIQANLILLRTAQTLYICGFLLYATSFIKSWYIIFSGKNDNFLTRIKQTRGNQDLILKVIETIKNKSENIQEYSSTNPFPEEHKFEHISYDDLNTKKTIERFYENEIVGFQKYLGGENVYSIKYSLLSGKVYRGKEGSDIWGFVLTAFVFLISIISGLIFGFDVYPSISLIYIIISLIVILLISFILKFIKRETIGLYDMNDNVKYWTWVTKSNKEKLEDIIEYVQSRIPAGNKEVPLKE
jgi:hypothetical protein